MRRALFLDRDGVINTDHGYVSRIEDFHFQPGIFDLIRLSWRLGLLPVVVTNQSGIGRGYYEEEAFRDLTGWMVERFRQEGAPIAAVYYCPYHPEAPDIAYRAAHSWRKPLPGMLLAARDDLGLDLSASVILGDKPSDIAAGIGAGLRTNLLLAGPDAPTVSGPRPTATLPDIAAAAAWLAGHVAPAAPLTPPPGPPLIRRG